MIFLPHFLNKIKQSPGREYEQAFIRIVIGISVFIYTFVSHGHTPEIQHHVLIEVIVYTAVGMGILGWIYISPFKNIKRYFLSSFIDMLGLSYAMYLGNEVGAALYPLYLWVTFGYGFRFGIPYLTASAIFGVIGFITVFIASSYWKEHIILFSGLLGGLILLPIYVSTLLRRLRNAIDEAKVASQAKGQFLANMSHELRTPLIGITGSNDLLRNTVLNSKQQQYIKTIDYSVETLLSLIDKILDISKIEAGKLEITHEEFDLHQILNSTVGMLEYQARNKDLFIKLYIEPDVPYALIGDPKHLRQILMNLIINSIKFTDVGGIKVNVTLKERQAANCSILFEIIDTGCGIKQRDQKKIFERFSQADGSETRIHGGAGLGTAIAKELSEKMGGSIELDSIYGEGSTFRVTLPFVSQPIDWKSSTDLSKANIIAISDRNQTLLSLIETLEGWGITLKEVDSASDAFTHINRAIQENNPIHAIIITKPLIDINAVQFAQAVRSKSILANVSLILLNNGIDASTRTELMNSGFNYIMDERFNKSLMFNALHSSPLLEKLHENVEELSAHITRRKSTKKYHILLAEDNETNRQLFKRILEQGGHSVVTVADGEEAIEALEKDEFDLCIVDMHMPNMGGIQTAQLYRFMYPGSQMPFVVLTANATTDAIHQCEKAGIDLYLTKPIRSHALLSSIETLVPKSKGKEVRKEVSPVNIDSATEEQAVLNPQALHDLELLNDDKKFLNELVQGFVNDGNTLLNKLEESKVNNYPAFVDAAHAFKGNAGSVGASLLYKVAHQAYHMTSQEYKTSATEYVDKIRKEYLRAHMALLKYANSQSGLHLTED
jgi:two-component system sensor histidine kinase RpfC